MLYRTISQQLEREGVEVIDPEVGEYVTSLDMAGCSLTLCWLDDEIEALLRAPAAAPGYRMAGTLPTDGRVALAAATRADSVSRRPRDPREPPIPAPRRSPRGPPPPPSPPWPRRSTSSSPSSAVSTPSPAMGTTEPGWPAGCRPRTTAAAQAGPTVADVVDAAALAFADAAGGASGALWGAGLLALGRALRSPRGTADGLREPTLDVATVGAALARCPRGNGAPRRRRPATRRSSTHSARSSLPSRRRGAGRSRRPGPGAVPAAQEGATATAGLAATRGRAATHGERSRGTPDPGAVSLAAALAAAGEAITAACAPSSPPAEARPGMTMPRR